MAAARARGPIDVTDPTGPDRFRRVRELFDASLDLPPGERDGWLRAQCGEDIALQREVRELLDADAAPTWTASEAVPSWIGRTLPPGTRVGSFTIVRCIGEGGMGAVYEALQERPHRTVALKTLRAGSDSPRARRRFEYESELLGRLQHPGIAQIHEAGTFDADGREVPFLAMEMLAGARAIDDYVADRQLDIRPVLALFIAICDAVQHAHQHGVVHRDLKPSNLLVDDHGCVKVIDFGIAQALDTEAVRRTLHTETGVILGTVAYMSPEQLDPALAAPDARTDIYSLGVLLFQLLTGRLPHDLDTLPVAAALNVIAERDVPSPSSYGWRNQQTPMLELDWIVRRATERNRDERYQTVAALAADVRRFLADQPVEAGPPSTTYRLRKFVRRHRTAAIGTGLTLLAMLAGAITTSIGWQHAVAAEARTAQKRAELERVTYGFWETTQIVDNIDRIKSGGIAPDVLRQLDATAARLDDQTIERPSIEAALRLRLARTFTEFGVNDRATEQFERALQRLAADPQPMLEVRLRALTQFGTLLVTSGKIARGIKMLRDATALAEERPSLFADPPALPRCRLAYALHQSGRFAEARDQYEAALDSLAQQPIPQPALRMQCLLGRGNARRALGERAAARRDIEAAIRIGRESLGDRDHRTLGARVDLAVLLLGDRNTIAEAAELLRDVTETRTATLGPTHVQTISSVLNLAYALHRQQQFAESERLCTRYLEAARAADIGSSIPLLKLRFNLGVAQMEQHPKKIAAAEQTFRDLVADGANALPPDHWMTFAFRARLGMCRALAAQAETDDPKVRRALLDDAREQLQQAVAGLDRKLGPANRQTIEAAKALLDVYRRYVSR